MTRFQKIDSLIARRQFSRLSQFIAQPAPPSDLSYIDNLYASVIKEVLSRITLPRDGIDGKNGIDGLSIKGKNGRDGRDGGDGTTPTKGIDYFTTNEIEAIKNEILTQVITQNKPYTLEIDVEMVKKIVQIMHSLPETDKLEVSKGIRNAQSFLFGGTKYKTEELMRGGGDSHSSETQVYNEVVAGSGTTFTLAYTPIAGTVRVYARGQRLTLTTNYTISGAIITTVDTWAAGDITSDYAH